MKNIKCCTSLIKCALLAFKNLTLNCGPFKSILSIPSQVDFFFGGGSTSDEVAIVGVCGGGLIDVRETE